MGVLTFFPVRFASFLAAAFPLGVYEYCFFPTLGIVKVLIFGFVERFIFPPYPAHYRFLNHRLDRDLAGSSKRPRRRLYFASYGSYRFWWRNFHWGGLRGFRGLISRHSNESNYKQTYVVFHNTRGIPAPAQSVDSAGLVGSCGVVVDLMIYPPPHNLSES